MNDLWTLLIALVGCGAILEGININKKKKVRLNYWMFWWVLPWSKRKQNIFTGKDAERFAKYNILAGAGLILIALMIYFS